MQYHSKKHVVKLALQMPASQTLIPRAWHGYEEWIREVRLGLGEGIAGTVAQRREGPEPPPKLLVQHACEHSIRTFLGLPIAVRDEVLGICPSSTATPCSACSSSLVGSPSNLAPTTRRSSIALWPRPR